MPTHAFDELSVRIFHIEISPKAGALDFAIENILCIKINLKNGTVFTV